MPFWRKESEEEKRAKQELKARQENEKLRQAECIAALERGEIPPIARERLLKERDLGRNFFSSDLSTPEFLLTKQAGFQTLGQVMGTSFFKISFWGNFSSYQRWTGELSAVTLAMSDARSTAVDRMRQESALLGASGVIGVRVQKRRHEWSSNVTEFTAFGTAIKIPDWPDGEEPFTSALNGQEFWQLYKDGYLPRSVVMGNCAYYIHMDPNTRNQIYGWFAPNQEVYSFTEGYRNAARSANTRMQQELARLSADGAVGVSVDPGREFVEYEINDVRYTDMLLNYVMIGTAVSAHPNREPNHTAPLVCLDLASKSYRQLGSTAEYENNYWDAADRNLVGEDDE